MKFILYWKYFVSTVLVAVLSLNAYAGLLGVGGDSWKEEVLLHNGQTLIVERNQTYGGRGEIGQSSPVKMHSIRFLMPPSGRTVTWTSEYSDELGRTNFNLLALYILDDTPYLITEPNLCLAYNKWGRPNPPYIIFKHDGRSWQQIELSDLPKAFDKINLIINNGRVESINKVSKEKGYISADGVAAFNSSLKQPQYKIVLRTPIQNYGETCIKTNFYGEAGWLSSDWFADQPSLAACLRFCEQKKIGAEICPCNTVYEVNK